MKKYTFPITLISLFAALTSCDKDNVRREEFRQEIEISTEAASTKTDGTDTYQGNNLGLFIDYGNAAPTRLTMSNIKWDRNGSGWTPAEQMLWKDASTSAALYAYAPYTDGQNDRSNIVFAIPEDQKDGVDKADLVSWTRTDFTPDNSNPDFVNGKVQINFSHRLTKLTVSIKKGTSIPSDVSIDGTTLLSTAEKAILSLDSQKITSSQGSLDISMHKMSDCIYEAVFCPGSGQDAGAKMLTVSLSDGTSYNFTVPSSGLITGGLQTGKSYVMNLRIGRDIIEPDSDYLKVFDWFDNTPIDGGEIKPEGFAGGTGTAGDPFLISNEDELKYFFSLIGNGHTFYNQHVKLSNAIHINGDFSTIKNLEDTFEGHFDGADMGVYMENANWVCYKTPGLYHLFGFFFRVKGRDSEHMASIENLQLYSANISGYSEIDGGFLCCNARYAVIKNCKVEGSVIYDTPDTGYSEIGGLASSINNSIVENCTTKVTFSHTGAGERGRFAGLSWELHSSTVKNCGIEIDAAQERDLCGLTHYSKNVTVESTTISGHLNTATNSVTGMFGDLDGAVNIKDCTIKAKLAHPYGTGCGGFADKIDEDCTGKFERCAFIGSFDSYSSNHYIVAYDDDSEVEFIDCWYSKEAYENSNKKMSRNTSKNYGIVEKN